MEGPAGEMYERPKDGSLVLPPLPGEARPVLELDEDDCGNGHAETRLLCPYATAAEPCGSGILVVDASLNRVKRVHLRPIAQATESSQNETDKLYLGIRVETILGFGGAGHAPRQLYRPRGIARLASGAIVVADSGNHRIQIFSTQPYALVRLWGATDSAGYPRMGRATKEFAYPFAVAADDASQSVYAVQ